MEKARDISACLLWLGAGLVLWYSEAFQGKAVNVGLWVGYGASYLILVALLGWWNYEPDEE